MATNPAGLSHESTSRVDGFFWLRGKMMGDEKWGFWTGWDGERLACDGFCITEWMSSKVFSQL